MVDAFEKSGERKTITFLSTYQQNVKTTQARRKREQKNQAVEHCCGEIMAEEPNGRNDPPPRRVLGD